MALLARKILWRQECSGCGRLPTEAFEIHPSVLPTLSSVVSAHMYPLRSIIAKRCSNPRGKAAPWEILEGLSAQSKPGDLHCIQPPSQIPGWRRTYAFETAHPLPDRAAAAFSWLALRETTSFPLSSSTKPQSPPPFFLSIPLRWSFPPWQFSVVGHTFSTFFHSLLVAVLYATRLPGCTSPLSVSSVSFRAERHLIYPWWIAS